MQSAEYHELREEVSTLRRQMKELMGWKEKVDSFIAQHHGSNEPCWFCGEKKESTT
jgi:hypothetical protein